LSHTHTVTHTTQHLQHLIYWTGVNVKLVNFLLCIKGECLQLRANKQISLLSQKRMLQ
jgi:hypothetical protein